MRDEGMKTRVTGLERRCVCQATLDGTGLLFQRQRGARRVLWPWSLEDSGREENFTAPAQIFYRLTVRCVRATDCSFIQLRDSQGYYARFIHNPLDFLLIALRLVSWFLGAFSLHRILLWTELLTFLQYLQLSSSILACFSFIFLILNNISQVYFCYSAFLSSSFV